MDEAHPAPLRHAAGATLCVLLALVAWPLPPQAAAAADPHTCGIMASSDERDSALARLACTVARDRFAALFGVQAPRVQLVLHDEAGYRVTAEHGVAVVFWPRTTALTQQLRTGTGADERIVAQWREVLPHEIMHALTVAHFYGDAAAAGDARYGTPLPDWFEEGIGIWGEPENSRNGRIAQARRLPAARLDLAAILRNPHPAAADPALLAAREGAPLPPDEALWSFYPQSIAVLAFVHETGGAAAVHELALRFVADPASTGALAGLPGMPVSMDGVLQAWQRWLTLRSRASS